MDSGRSHTFEIATAVGGGLLCLIFVCLFVEASAIEEDISTRVVESIADADLYWSSVDAQGQHVVLEGVAPDYLARDLAHERATNVFGVTGVDNRIEVLAAGQNCQKVLNEYLSNEQILFRTGRDELSPTSFELLDMLAMTVRTCSARIEIAGHTDNKGDSEINAELSQRRAEAVRDHLVKRGASKNQLTARGYGETRPIADNQTRDGRERNRRIEFRVIGQA